MLDFPVEGANLRRSAVSAENLRFGIGLSRSVRPLKWALRTSHFSHGFLEKVLFRHTKSVCYELVLFKAQLT